MNKDKVKKAMDILNQYHNPASSVLGEKLPFGKAKRYLKTILENATIKETEEYREDVKKQSDAKRKEIATKRELMISKLKELFPDYSEEQINNLIKPNSFDSLHTKANAEVKEGLSSFVVFLKDCNVPQEKIDKLFASGLISIVTNGYLKLGDVIIGKNKYQNIQTQINNCQGEQFVDFLSQASDILGLPFHKPNDMDNKLDISKDEFIENNQNFWNKNAGSNLFNSIGQLINRSCIWIPCFATSDNRVMGCIFWHRSVCGVSSFINAYSNGCISTDVS